MSAKDILKANVHDLVPRSQHRNPLPEGPGIRGADFSLKASLEVLLRHAGQPIDKEILEALTRHLSDDKPQS